MIYGYCNGFFGRDSYEPKRVEAEGRYWIVARRLDEAAQPEFASFSNDAEMERLLDEWSVKPKEDE